MMKFIAFQARHPKPDLYDLTRFVEELNTSPLIVAEIINDHQGKKVFNYAHLRNERLFPSISEKSTQSM